MTKDLHGHTDCWSAEISRVVEGRAADGWSLPALFPDGSDLPDAELDALAEAMMTGLERRLAGEQAEGSARQTATAHRTRRPS